MPDPGQLPPLSDAQMEIMQRVWARGRASVTDVWQDLSQEREIARNTVLTVMDRLTRRGWLQKTAVGNMHLYEAVVAEQAALRTLVERLVESTFSGDPNRLVMALLDGRGLSAAEAARIRRMIDEKRDPERDVE